MLALDGKKFQTPRDVSVDSCSAQPPSPNPHKDSLLMHTCKLVCMPQSKTRTHTAGFKVPLHMGAPVYGDPTAA